MSDDVRKLCEAATPGPWAWFGNQHGVYLATTHSGRRYVMGFRRMGLQGAQPSFQVDGWMRDASELVEFEVGDGTARGFKEGKADPSVYRYDISGIDCPDARFIAAAREGWPRALDRVEALERALGRMIYETTHLSPCEDDGSHWCRISAEALVEARAALATPEGADDER